MVFRTLLDGELDHWAEHCASVFDGPGDTVDYFRNHYLLDPTRDPKGVFLAVSGDSIASTLRVFRREIYIKGHRVPMGGIGEVCTKPEFQRQGLSGALLRMAVEYMEREGFCTSLLFTGTQSHYARYGWFTHPMRSVVLDAPKERFDCTIRPMTGDDVRAVSIMHREYVRQFDGCVAREADGYWTDWMSFAWESPHVIERDGSIVAYVDGYLDARRKLVRAKDYAQTAAGPGMAAALGMYAQAREWQCDHVAVPGALMPRLSGPFLEDRGPMLRLNSPFELDGEVIDSPSRLSAVLSEMSFFGADGF